MASSLPESIPLEVSDLPPADYKQASALATAAIGPLRATALGLGPESVQPDNVTLHALDQHYLEYGLRRTRRLLAVYQEGALVGLALCHANSIPMNFSFLCRRTEILVHPNASNRDTVVTALARASIAEAAVRGDSLCALLISPRDTPAALKAGYIDTHKQYASLLWSREDELGAPSALEGVERLYTAMEARLSMRQATIPAARKLNSQT